MRAGVERHDSVTCLRYVHAMKIHLEVNDHRARGHHDEHLARVLLQLVPALEANAMSLDRLTAATAALAASTDALTAAVNAIPSNEALIDAQAASVEASQAKVDAATAALASLTTPPPTP